MNSDPDYRARRDAQAEVLQLVSAISIAHRGALSVVLTDVCGARRAERADGHPDTTSTPTHMAPEVLAGHAASVGSDIYALVYAQQM